MLELRQGMRDRDIDCMLQLGRADKIIHLLHVGRPNMEIIIKGT